MRLPRDTSRERRHAVYVFGESATAGFRSGIEPYYDEERSDTFIDWLPPDAASEIAQRGVAALFGPSSEGEMPEANGR